MPKTTKTDEPTTEPASPTIEERLDTMTATFLDAVDAEGKKYARSEKTNWHGLTTPDRIGMARQVRSMVKTALRTPALAAGISDQLGQRT